MKKLVCFMTMLAIMLTLVAVPVSASEAISALNIQVRADQPDWGNFIIFHVSRPIYDFGTEAPFNVEQLGNATQIGIEYPEYQEVVDSILDGITITMEEDVDGTPTMVTSKLKDVEHNLILFNPSWNAEGSFNETFLYIDDKYNVHGDKDITINIAAGTKAYNGNTFGDIEFKYDAANKTWYMSPRTEVLPLLIQTQTDGEIDLLTITFDVIAPMHWTHFGKDENTGAMENVEGKTSADVGWNQAFINSIRQGILFNGKTIEELATENGTTVEEMIDVTVNSYNPNLDITFNDINILDFSQDLFEIEFTDFVTMSAYSVKPQVYYFDADAWEWVTEEPVRTIQTPTPVDNDTPTPTTPDDDNPSTGDNRTGYMIMILFALSAGVLSMFLLKKSKSITE